MNDYDISKDKALVMYIKRLPHLVKCRIVVLRDLIFHYTIANDMTKEEFDKRIRHLGRNFDNL